MTHICVSKLITIGSDNGVSPGRRQAIIWTNAGILSIRPLETNFSEILIEIIIVSFKIMRLKVSSAMRRPFCLGLNVLNLVNDSDCRSSAYQKCGQLQLGKLSRVFRLSASNNTIEYVYYVNMQPKWYSYIRNYLATTLFSFLTDNK